MISKFIFCLIILSIFPKDSELIPVENERKGKQAEEAVANIVEKGIDKLIDAVVESENFETALGDVIEGFLDGNPGKVSVGAFGLIPQAIQKGIGSAVLGGLKNIHRNQQMEHKEKMKEEDKKLNATDYVYYLKKPVPSDKYYKPAGNKGATNYHVIKPSSQNIAKFKRTTKSPIVDEDDKTEEDDDQSEVFLHNNKVLVNENNPTLDDVDDEDDSDEDDEEED